MKNSNDWPVLNFAELQETIETLHQWIQIVGKIRLRTMPWQNHSWHVTLYVTAQGFSTHAIPHKGQIIQLDFDFKQHKLFIHSSATDTQHLELRTRTVADFYKSLFNTLSRMGIEVSIHGSPNEMEPAIPFAQNTANKTYDPRAAHTIWRAMLKVSCVFSQFRSEFVGKCSPVHLFWGAFDLAVTRFSGRPAPLHPGGVPNMPLEVMQEAYSQEVSSAGFWLGSKDFPSPLFYAYAYPSPEGFAKQNVLPEQAFYSQEMGEFILKYEDVIHAADPEKTLYDFLQSTYEAAVHTAGWNSSKLERQP